MNKFKISRLLEKNFWSSTRKPKETFEEVCLSIFKCKFWGKIQDVLFAECLRENSKQRENFGGVLKEL